MRLRLKLPGIFKNKKIHSFSEIDHIDIKEDILKPEKTQIHLLFKGKKNSGILSLSQEEAERLMNTLKSSMPSYLSSKTNPSSKKPSKTKSKKSSKKSKKKKSKKTKKK